MRTLADRGGSVLVALAAAALVACAPASRPVTTSPPTARAPGEAGQPTDRDQDRIVSGDRCPDRPEVYNGFEDDDGCPDRPPAADCVHVDVIHVAERIRFEPNASRLDRAGEAILEALASALTDYPNIDVGVAAAAPPTDEAAAELARARVEVVRRALLGHGVGGARMEGIVTDAPGLEDQVWFPILRVDGEPVGQQRPAARLLPHSVDCDADWLRWRDEGEALDCDCLDERPAWADDPALGAGALPPR